MADVTDVTADATLLARGVTPGPARRPTRPGIVLAIVSAAQFMFILDLAIVVLAVPSIQQDLGLDRSDLQWVIVAYGLTLGGFLLLGGRTADLVGRRQVLVAGLAVFTAASLAAGLAGGFLPLVAARALQGLGAAFAAPAALSILTSTFAEGPSRNRALGIFGAAGASAASLGLVVGGALTTGPGWTWVFFMNVPIGVILITMALANIAKDRPVGGGTPDVAGAVTVTTGLISIVYGIHESSSEGWASGPTLTPLLLGAALLTLFVVVERRAPSPILPGAVFRQPTLGPAVVVAALVFGSFIGFNLQISLFMQQTLGYSAIETGVAWLATSISAVFVGAVLAPRAVNRFGAGRVLVIGQSIAVAGLLLLSRMPTDAAYVADLFPGLFLVGIAIGLSGTAVQIAAFTGVETSLAGVAGGALESFREIGGALGTAVIATVAVVGAGDVLDADALRDGALAAAALSCGAVALAATLLRRAERQAVGRH